MFSLKWRNFHQHVSSIDTAYFVEYPHLIKQPYKVQNLQIRYLFGEVLVFFKCSSRSKCEMIQFFCLFCWWFVNEFIPWYLTIKPPFGNMFDVVPTTRQANLRILKIEEISLKWAGFLTQTNESLGFGTIVFPIDPWSESSVGFVGWRCVYPKNPGMSDWKGITPTFLF